LSYAELKELSSSMLRAWGQNPKNDTRPDGFTQGVYRSVVMMREICAKKRAARRPTKVVKTECANGGDNGLDGQVSDLSDSSASKRKITELETQISEVCSQHKVEMRSTKSPEYPSPPPLQPPPPNVLPPPPNHFPLPLQS